MGIIADLGYLTLLAQEIAREACEANGAAQAGGQASGKEETGGSGWTVFAPWLSGNTPIDLPPQARDPRTNANPWGGGRP